MSRRAKVFMHLSYRIEKDARMKERLLAILQLSEGKTVDEVAEFMRRCEKTVRNWLKEWNNGGI